MIDRIQTTQNLLRLDLATLRCYAYAADKLALADMSEIIGFGFDPKLLTAAQRRYFKYRTKPWEIWKKRLHTDGSQHVTVELFNFVRLRDQSIRVLPELIHVPHIAAQTGSFLLEMQDGR